MTHKLRFADLKERGIVQNWPQLRMLQQKHGFPPGRLLSPNVRVWDEEDELAPWLAARPTKNTRPLQGRPKALHERRVQRDAAKAEATLAAKAEAEAGEQPTTRKAAERKARQKAEPVAP